MANPKGATGAQNQIAGSQQNFMSTLQNDFGTAFAGSQNIINGLKKAAETIQAAGPSQFGFSQPETTALNTLATTQNATNYAQARAAAAQSAAAAGGSSVLPNGATAGTTAQIASNAANAQSNAILGIQEAGYRQGNQNYENANKTLETTAQLENPNGLAGEANQAGSQAFGSATTVQKTNEAASPWAQVGGLVGSLGGAALNMVAPGAGSLFSAGLGSITKGQQSADLNQGWQNAGGMDSGGDEQIYANTLSTLPH